ncbi:MAG: TlyA family rRNA (cytidine-2'-O)-methyltransferase, partial [Alphaproteobacteria bacterium]
IGRAGIDKGGIVKSESARVRVLDDIVGWMTVQGWRVDGTMLSPITGADGNQEYLLAARNQ